MSRLKLIPRFARLFASSRAGSLSRSFASGAGGDGGGDDGDYFTQFLSEAPSRNEQSQQDRGFGRQGRFGGRGGGGFTGRGRGGEFMGRGRGFMGRGGRSGRGRFGPRDERPFDMEDDPIGPEDGHSRRGRFGPRGMEDDPIGPVLSEEDLKLEEELDQKQSAPKEDSDEDDSDEDDSDDFDDEQDDGYGDDEPRSIYAGFIDPKFDEVIKENRMLKKKLRYKDKAFSPTKFKDEEDEEDLSYLDRDSSDDERKVSGQGRGARASDQSDDEEDDLSGSEDEVDEEEWEIMNDMNDQEFEKHLKHREHGKQLRKEYDSRIEALGDKAQDREEVEKVQKLMMKKWRAHYFMPRMVTPMEKEEMWQKHKENPEEWTIDKLADEYNVCKARVHAILFLWDIRKHEGESKTAEEETKTYLDSLCFDEYGKPCLPPHMGEDKWVTTWNTKPNYKIMPEDWEGSVRTEEEAIEEASTKEEAMMLEEFVRRLEFNKLQMCGLMKQKKHDRRRPPGGWTYLVEKLGPEGKRGKRGGFKFVATADGKHRKLNDLEKLVLKREAVRPRKRIL